METTDVQAQLAEYEAMLATLRAKAMYATDALTMGRIGASVVWLRTRIQALKKVS